MAQRVTFTHENLQQQSREQSQGQAISRLPSRWLPLFGGSPFSLMSSTLTALEITTDGEGKERELNSGVRYQFFLGR